MEMSIIRHDTKHNNPTTTTATNRTMHCSHICSYSYLIEEKENIKKAFLNVGVVVV